MGTLLAMIASSCGPDFNPYWKIDRLRVMAIKADPVVAEQGDRVELSALVYAPGDPQIDYDWSWCPVRVTAENEYECPLEAEEIGEQFGDGGSAAVDEDFFDLGDEETAEFINFFAEDDVREFCEALQEELIGDEDDPELAGLLPDIDCEEGWEVSVRLEVDTGDDSVIASKRFMLSGGADEPNQNPEFAAYHVRPVDPDDLEILRNRAGWDIPAGRDHEHQWMPVSEDEKLRVVENVTLELRAYVDDDSLQVYTPRGQDEPRLEALEYRHFTTTGTFNTSTGLFSPEHNTLRDASNVELTLSPDRIEEECREPESEGCGVRLWTVVRDARLGVDWIERRLLVLSEDG